MKFQITLAILIVSLFLNVNSQSNQNKISSSSASSVRLINNQTFSNNSSTSFNWPVLGLSVFSIFGILGNLLVCLTIRRDQALQTRTNYYLFSLAIADLAVCVLVIPLSIIQDFSSKNYFINFIDVFPVSIL